MNNQTNQFLAEAAGSKIEITKVGAMMTAVLFWEDGVVYAEGHGFTTEDALKALEVEVARIESEA
ncbi:hypothetical protein CPT_Summit_040 [Stenotrophomonas phage Summit]|nr:hypothetical protein CPT_Summit_040 [Stenotrophomonas phage Summit]